MNNSLLSFGAKSVGPEILEQTLTIRAEIVAEIERKCTEKAINNTTYQSLVIAPRGSGKTHLTKVLYHRLKNNPELSSKIVIAYMSEDEVGIANFTDLMVNILRAFIRYNEPNSENIEDEISKASMIDNANEREVFLKNILLKYAKKRVIILLIENFDKIMNTLGDNGQGSLRDFIHQYNNLSIIATSPSLISSLRDSQKPFYNFFNVYQLNALSYNETIEFFKAIAKMQNNIELLEEINNPSSQGKLRAIYELTEGNHRLLVTFYSFLEADFKSDLSSNFIKVMNNLKPYYEQFVNALPPNQQKIVRYLSSNRKAIKGKKLARACFLDSNTNSKMLSLLYERGMIDKNKVGKDVYYELKEPLMRICFEIGDNPNGIAKLFVDFLAAYYDQEILSQKYLEYKYGARFQDSNLKNKFKIEAQMYELALNTSEKLALSRVQSTFEKIDNHKEIEKNIKNFNSIAQLQLNNIIEIIEKGIHFLETKQYKQAIKLFDKAISINPENEVAYINKGIALTELDSNIEALKCYKKAISINPNISYAYNNIGICYSKLGDDEKALKNFLNAIKYNSKYEDALYNLGKIFFKLNRYEDALIQYLKLIIIIPEDVDILYNIGILNRLLNKNNLAIKYFKKAIKKRPLDSLILNELALVYNQMGKISDAKECLIKAIEANPSNGDLYHNLGIIYDNLNDYENSIINYLEAIKINPENEVTYNNLGAAYSKLNKYNEAIEAYLKAIELKSDYWEAIANIGIYYSYIKDYKNALYYFQKALSINPNDEKSLFNTGVAYIMLNDNKKAIAQYQKLLHINPNNEQAKLMLATLYNSNKMYPKAIKIFKDILKNNKSDSTAYNNLAYAYLLNNDIDKGIEIINNGIEIDPNNINIKYSLLGAIIRLNDINKSKELLESLINKTDSKLFPSVFQDDILYNLFKYGSESFTKVFFDFILKLLHKKTIPDTFWASLNTSLFNVLIDIENYSLERLISIKTSLEVSLIDYPKSIIPMKFFSVGIDSLKKNDKTAIYSFTKEERSVFTESILDKRLNI